MNSPSLLDVLVTRFPFRQLGRVVMILAGIVVVAWGSNEFRQNGLWLDLAIYCLLGLGAFYWGLTFGSSPTEFPLGRLLGAGQNAGAGLGPLAPSMVNEESAVPDVGGIVAHTGESLSPGTGLWAPARSLPAVRLGEIARLWPLAALPFAAWVQGTWLRELLAGNQNPSLSSLVLMGVAVLLFWPLMRDPGRAAQAASSPAAESGVEFRPRMLMVSAGAMLLAFVAASGNRFTSLGVLAWIVGIAAGVLAFWEETPGLNWRDWVSRLSQDEFRIRITRVALLLFGVTLVALFFRFWRLDAVPPEMTSDHVEKLLDVNDILRGEGRIFFERNTGREPLQFYFAAWLAGAMGTGLSHLTLKITAALAGLLTIPFIYLLGKELEDETLGLLGALLAAFAFWPTAISRVGLRFPFSPVFVAPALFFLFRGLRTGRRNDFIWAGLTLGAGLFGYSPFRDMAVAVAIPVAAHLARTQPRGVRLRLLSNVAVMGFVTLSVFIPLLRYASENPEMFWYRSMGRIANDSLSGADLRRVFWSNQWNVFQMFNWRGDQVWVNALPGRPILDVVTGGLLILGAAYLLARTVRRRSLRDGLTLGLVPVLMLPSSLSLAYPAENPSVVRAGAALVIVFLIAAQPLRLAIAYARAKLGEPRGAWAGGLLVGGLLVISAGQNYRMYFVDYFEQYLGPAQNASEIGGVIRDFARSVGSYDTAVVKAYPHWADTRAVGIYAGKFGWDQAYLDNTRFAELQSDPRAKLYLLHRDDREAIAALRAVYPDGVLSRYYSARPSHDFLMFFVPGTFDLDEDTLPPVGSP